MPLSVASVLPGRAGKIIFVCAMSSVCAAYLVSQHRAARTEEADVSLMSKDSSRPDAASPASAAAGGPGISAAPAAASTAPASDAPAFTVKNAPVEHSFAAAARSMGVDAATTAMLAQAFHGDLDLARDLRAGDRVSAVFDKDGTDGAPGAPLAVRIARGTVSHDVFLYRTLQGKPFYYSKDGASTTPTFERYPLNFSRVSSQFALRRLDPVTHQWQSHDGVDLAAPSGTPIHATARGVVRFIGQQTGYGKVIVIQNPAPYSTTFAHLSRFAKGLHRGSRVSRDQVIGYVGETGWATGPHLHYEVHVHHVPKDPLKVQFPQATRLGAAELQQFKARAAELTALL
ncbi:Murein DD-endopeptidase MepM and murein hydrolase activator NlpD, contain LysM domain [Paraburkholderia fungorum]|uniref:Murein DD-endopeptidase MepM and murein hydrolase activator NlpD, contain LysM domain n=2 Tax=Paraburkholderia fungorum TaxID=134537 RepID=A0A1H1ICT8_9BURK|nr:Murein DD-endopeptidase MepM and murein hydrolase activator NlpD, contain LysM domain [Paraburkholderia fungorum]